MRLRAIGLLTLLLCCAPLPGAQTDKRSYEDVVKQMVETMEALSTTLATIHDEDSAKVARPELRKAAGKWNLVRKSAEGIPPPAKEEKDRLEKQYKSKLVAAQKKLFGEVARVRTLRGGPEALLEISGILEQKTKEEKKEPPK